MQTRRALPAILAAALATAACASATSDPGIASAGRATSTGAASGGGGPADPNARTDGITFAQCLRRHGVDAGDPPNPSGKPEIPENVDPNALNEAIEACREFAPNIGREPPAMDAATLEIWRTWAACLREQGINAEDPKPGDVRPPIPDGERGGPDIAPAIEACNSVLPADMKIRQDGSDGPKGEGDSK